MRTFIIEDPYKSLDAGKPWSQRGRWPCSWITPLPEPDMPFVCAFRRRFAVPGHTTIRVHVSADERYELFLDGTRVGRGSERGDRNNWFYETYDLQLGRGDHVLVARVWALGPRAPYAQMSVKPGFLLGAEGSWLDEIATGKSEWEWLALSGYEFLAPGTAWGTGARVRVRGALSPWGWESGEGGPWAAVATLHEGTNGLLRNEYSPIHLMKPATLPPMLEDYVRAGVVRHVAQFESRDTRPIAIDKTDHLRSEQGEWQGLLRDRALTVPPHTRRRVIVDLEDYYCAYPEIVTSGGKESFVRLHWAESLFHEPEARTKGNRNEVEGKFFAGVGDIFEPDGGEGRRFDTLWWEAGRYLELLVETAAHPLTLERLRLRETHYPYEIHSSFESSDSRLQRVTPIALRGLAMCSHETYMDCPYYEQLQYVGDTRLEALTTYAVTRDDRLPRKALTMFDQSRLLSGLTQSRYPSRVTQIIPPFSLWYIGMVYDYALWRNDRDFVRRLMPGVRSIVECFLGYLNGDGLVEAPNGWNYMDWVPSWRGGIPPDGELGASGVINWQLVLVLTMLRDLERLMGESELAWRAERLAREMAARVTDAFWDSSAGLFADDLEKKFFSEHAQCLAILSGTLDEQRRTVSAEGLVTHPGLARTTIYFTHYLFETYRVLQRMDLLFERLGLWFEIESRGFKTTFEEPEPSRSDCHAWGAHPVYHYYATILGIRPGSMGFGSVRIEPQLGPLKSARGMLAHPRGLVGADFRMEDDVLTGSVILPDGVEGVLVANGRESRLLSGKQEV